MEVRRKNVGYAATQWVQDYKVREVDAGMWAVLDKEVRRTSMCTQACLITQSAWREATERHTVTIGLSS